MDHTITIAPAPDAAAVVSAFVQDSLSTWAVERSVQIKLLIALDEMLSNIVKYSGAAAVTVGCEQQPDMVLLHFADDGIPFDPLAAGEIDPDAPLEDRAEGGLGIFMVKNSMDHLQYEYREGKNCLTLGCRTTPLCKKEATP